MGHMYRRGRNGNFSFQFFQDGQRVRVATGSPDEAVARRMLKEYEAKVTLKEPVIQAARTTYDELRTLLVEHYRATGSRNLEEVGYRLAHLDRHFRGVRASTITTAAITRYIVQRKAEVIVSPRTKARRHPASGTVNREVALLLRMLRLGAKRGKLARVPIVDRDDKPKEAAPRSGFFEDRQFEAVRRRLPGDLQLAVTIAHTFGWRMQSEVLTLQLAQVDLEAGTLRLHPGSTKNRDGRQAYVTPELKAMLTAQVARVKALQLRLGKIIPDLFVHQSGPGLVGTRIKDFRRAWKSACRAAGVPGMLRHDLRRTAVRNLVASGVAERVAMRLTGHRTRSVFDRYHIVSAGDLQEAAVKLAARGR